jgi:hypothetical protein
MSKLFNPERMTPRERVLAKYPHAAARQWYALYRIVVNDGSRRILAVAGNATGAWYLAAKKIEKEKCNG